MSFPGARGDGAQGCLRSALEGRVGGPARGCWPGGPWGRAVTRSHKCRGSQGCRGCRGCRGWGTGPQEAEGEGHGSPSVPPASLGLHRVCIRGSRKARLMASSLEVPRAIVGLTQRGVLKKSLLSLLDASK